MPSMLVLGILPTRVFFPLFPELIPRSHERLKSGSGHDHQREAVIPLCGRMHGRSPWAAVVGGKRDDAASSGMSSTCNTAKAISWRALDITGVYDTHSGSRTTRDYCRVRSTCSMFTKTSHTWWVGQIQPDRTLSGTPPMQAALSPITVPEYLINHCACGHLLQTSWPRSLLVIFTHGFLTATRHRAYFVTQSLAVLSKALRSTTISV